MTIDSHAQRLTTLSQQEHPRCIVCGASNQLGLRLQFSVSSDGSVKSVFPCSKLFQGYGGMLHGGVISSLLDGAMTNCLFAKGVVATTAELAVRFLHPVVIDSPAIVRACVTRSRSPLYIVEAELAQEGKALVRASGKFMEKRP